jgi:hypothetical protein
MKRRHPVRFRIYTLSISTIFSITSGCANALKVPISWIQNVGADPSSKNRRLETSIYYDLSLTQDADNQEEDFSVNVKNLEYNKDELSQYISNLDFSESIADTVYENTAKEIEFHILPYLINVDEDSIVVSASLNSQGTLYAILLLEGSAAPSS